MLKVRRQESGSRMCCLLLVSMLLVNGGCASIMSGTTQSLFVNSTPSGAMASVDGLRSKTPARFELKRNQSIHEIWIEKVGYEPVQTSVGRKVNPWLAGNLIWGYGLPIGLVVDFVSGGAWGLDNEKIDVSLSSRASPSPPNAIPINETGTTPNPTRSLVDPSP